MQENKKDETDGSKYQERPMIKIIMVIWVVAAFAALLTGSAMMTAEFFSIAGIVLSVAGIALFTAYAVFAFLLRKNKQRRKAKIGDSKYQERPVTKQEITRITMFTVILGVIAIAAYFAGMIMIMALIVPMAGMVLLIVGITLLIVFAIFVMGPYAKKMRMYRQYTKNPENVVVTTDGVEFRIQHRRVLVRLMGIMSIFMFLLFAAFATIIIVMSITEGIAEDEVIQFYLMVPLLSVMIIGLFFVCFYFFLYGKNHRVAFMKEGIIFQGALKTRIVGNDLVNREVLRFVVVNYRVASNDVRTVFTDRSNRKLFQTSINTAEFNEYLKANFTIKEINYLERKKYYR